MNEIQTVDPLKELKTRRSYTPLPRRFMQLFAGLGLTALMLTACDKVATTPKAQGTTPEPSPPTLITPEQIPPTPTVEVKPTVTPTITPEPTQEVLNTAETLSLNVREPSPLEQLTVQKVNLYGIPGFPFQHRIPRMVDMGDGKIVDPNGAGPAVVTETRNIGGTAYEASIFSVRPSGYRVEDQGGAEPTVYLQFSDPNGETKELAVQGGSMYVVSSDGAGGLEYTQLVHPALVKNLDPTVDESLRKRTASVSLVYYTEQGAKNDTLAQAMLVTEPQIVSPSDLAGNVTFDVPGSNPEIQQATRDAFQKMYEVALNPQNQGVEYDQLRVVLRYLSSTNIQINAEGRVRLFLDPAAIPQIPGINAPDAVDAFGGSDLFSGVSGDITWDTVWDFIFNGRLSPENTEAARKSYAAYAEEVLKPILGPYCDPRQWVVRS